jgi:K+-transporting ATPase ATPase C chain
MRSHLRANFWLLLLTSAVCCILYPLVLWSIGRTVFAHQTEGSLVRGKDGQPGGSLLIAQSFAKPEYFWPRPSAVSYNASASGASNWSASNPLLRERVARALGPIVKYRAGRLVGPDIEEWFRQQPPDFVSRWAADNSASAEQWIKDNAEIVALWMEKDIEDVKSAPGDATTAFFSAFALAHPGTWPSAAEEQGKKRIQPIREGTDIQAYLFASWLQVHPSADLDPVPADMVMTSGSGLDPHITLANARYQLDRVAAAWAERTGQERGSVRRDIERLLDEKAWSPLGGLAGSSMVNVLEVNRALQARYRPAG